MRKTAAMFTQKGCTPRSVSDIWKLKLICKSTGHIKWPRKEPITRNEYHLREVIKLRKDTVLNGKFSVSLMQPDEFLLSALNSLVET